MEIYWFMLGVCLFGVLAPWRLIPTQRRAMLFAVCVLITMLVGLRHEVGGDWFNYARQFDRVASGTFASAVVDGKDPAYYAFSWLVSVAGGSVHLLNLICAIPLGVGLYVFVVRRGFPWLALYAAIPYLVIVVGMGYTRQATAIGFTLVGLAALEMGKARSFVISLVPAAAFHKSAILLLPVGALTANRNKIWNAMWVCVAALIGGWLFLFDSADALVANYVASEYASASQGAGVRVLMNSIPAIIFLVFRSELSASGSQRNLWTLISLASLACIPLLSISATAVDRIALYFIPIQLFVFGQLPTVAKYGHRRAAIILCVLMYYALVQFVWLNYAAHASAWVPYQFVALGS